MGGDHHLNISANTPESVRRCVVGAEVQSTELYKDLLSYLYRNFGNPSSLLVFNSCVTRTNIKDSERIEREGVVFISFYFILFGRYTPS